MPLRPPRAFSQSDAEAVAAWRYPGEYAFYDMSADPDDLRDLLDPTTRAGRWHAVDGDDGALAGFFELKPSREAVEVGLGLRPDLCGHGLGEAFTRMGIDLIRGRHGDVSITLAVAAFNRRAATVYERCGFAVTGRHVRTLSGTDHEFVDMALPPVAGSLEPRT